MKIGIMQPYFFPYIGYFQLMNAVDEFVVYDNIEFTKKGWINRNRILANGKDVFITLPIKKDSDYLDVRDRHLADSWNSERVKMLNRIKESYRKAPQFYSVYPVIETCILYDESNLFKYILNSLNIVKSYLKIDTPLIISSTLTIDDMLKAEKKVIAICKARNANTYVNAIGGMELYSKETFLEKSIELKFIKSKPLEYTQLGDAFVPWLSIIDVMMFNPQNRIVRILGEYELT
jgi:hypothetical protein